MNSVLLKFVVTGLYVLVNGSLGLWIGSKGKPYGKIKIGIHIILSLGVLAGFISIIYELSTLNQPKTLAIIALIVMGLTLLCNLFTGITMALTKDLNKSFPTVHKTSTIVLLLSIIIGSILLLYKI